MQTVNGLREKTSEWSPPPVTLILVRSSIRKLADALFPGHSAQNVLGSSPMKAPAVIPCPNCKASIDHNAAICPRCGESFMNVAKAGIGLAWVFITAAGIGITLAKHHWILGSVAVVAGLPLAFVAFRRGR